MSCENYDPCFPDQPVVHRYLPIWASLPGFRNKPAFLWASDSPNGLSWTSVSYSQLSSAVDAMASKLLCFLSRGDALLVLCSPGLKLVELIFACQRAGLVAVPLIPPDPSAPEHLLRAVSQAKPKVAVADRRSIAALSTAVPCALQWLSVEQMLEGAPVVHSPEHLGCDPEDTYLLQYTSGATGIPKPVLVTAGAAAHNVREARRAYDLQPSSTIVSWLPQYHDCGLMFLLLSVVAGATCVLASPHAFLRRPRLWLELVTEFRATCTPVPAFALPLAVKRGGVSHGKLPLKLGSLRNLILINEPLYNSPVDEFISEFAAAEIDPSSISPSYGLAENCTFVSTAWPRDESGSLFRFPNMPCYKKLLPSARLGARRSGEEDGINIVVVDGATCEPVDDGMEGEIWVSSPSNAAGYLGHPSLTREVFNGRLRRWTSGCFVRTGDTGVIRGEERYLYVTGRTADMIDTGDERVQRWHAHYVETAAYSGSGEHLREGRLVAFGAELQVASMRKATLVVVAELQGKVEGLEAYRRICEGIRQGVWQEEGGRVGWVVLVESGRIPRTTSGKPRRWLAKHMLLQGSLQFVYEARFEKQREAAAFEDAGRGVAPPVRKSILPSFPHKFKYVIHNSKL